MLVRRSAQLALVARNVRHRHEVGFVALGGALTAEVVERPGRRLGWLAACSPSRRFPAPPGPNHERFVADTCCEADVTISER